MPELILPGVFLKKKSRSASDERNDFRSSAFSSRRISIVTAHQFHQGAGGLPLAGNQGSQPAAATLRDDQARRQDNVGGEFVEGSEKMQ
ncbi:MAG: hypothetical protein WCB16_10665 [Candidatus Binatus sp.]